MFGQLNDFLNVMVIFLRFISASIRIDRNGLRFDINFSFFEKEVAHVF